MALLGEFRTCFTGPSFAVFCALAGGFLAQTGRRTVCGMLVGARLSRVWSHHRAHRFFSAARWSPEQVSAVLAALIVGRLVPDGQPVTVAIDDTLFHRRGPKVHAASWFHDGSAQGGRKVGYGNNWVIAAIVVTLPFLHRPLALPVGFALVRKGTGDSRLTLGRRLVERLASTLPDRRIEVVADSAYAGRTLRALPAAITWTTRLRSNAALYQLAPPRTGRRGRPRLKGTKLAPLADLAATTTFTPTVVHRYGATTTVQAAVRNCPVVRRVRPTTGAGRPGPRPRHDRLRHRLGQHRPDRDPGTDDRTLRRPLVDRSRDRRRETDHRRRPGPQPATHRRGTHRPVRAGHHQFGDLLVRHHRLPPRRRHRGPGASPLVPRQGPALGR